MYGVQQLTCKEWIGPHDLEGGKGENPIMYNVQMYKHTLSLHNKTYNYVQEVNI